MFARLAQVWTQKIFVGFMSTRCKIVASYHCIQFQGNLMIQTQENGKKLHFGPDLNSLGPFLGQHFFFFFSSKSTISEKNNDPILRKIIDGRTDGQADEIDFIGRCPTKVERPKTSRLLDNS